MSRDEAMRSGIEAGWCTLCVTFAGPTEANP
ncbi:hypothetical protein P3T42_006424 [Paraburkholderia sp. GAS38]